MNRRKILFVTYADEVPDDGLSYVFELSNSMEKDSAILFLRRKRVMKRMEDAFSAIAFAEANEHETALKMMEGLDGGGNGGPGGTLGAVIESYRSQGIHVDVRNVNVDTMSTVREFLAEKSDIDLVLLSPSVSTSGNVTTKVLNRLVQTVAKPIVTMAKKHRLVSDLFPRRVAHESTK